MTLICSMFFHPAVLGHCGLLSWSQIQGSINFFIFKRALQEQSQESGLFALQKQVLSPVLTVFSMWLVSTPLLLFL